MRSGLRLQVNAHVTGMCKTQSQNRRPAACRHHYPAPIPGNQSTQPSANHRSPDLQHPDQQHLGRRLPARQLPHDVTETDSKRIVLALETAADVLHRLSRQDDEGPAGSCRAWPEMLRPSHVAASGKRRSGMARPSPAEITAMEEMIALLWSVTSRQRQLLWARACRVR